jgi:hypothetical protein
MAQVGSGIEHHVELLLSHLVDVWRRLPGIAAEIDQWDQIEQITFIEEWPLEEQRLQRLEQYVAEGALTLDPLARYGDLERIIAKNRPVLQQLLKG